MNSTFIPKVSILTKAYNVEMYITDCIESVLNQTFKDFEWIILENGSTDETGRILEEYEKRDSRIHLLKNKKNYNRSFPSKEGYYSYLDLVKSAKGQYITDLDSDDFWDLDFLKIMCDAMNEEMVDIVAAGSVQFENDNKEDVKRIIIPKAFHGMNIVEMGEHIIDFYDAFRPTWGKLISREFYIENLDYCFDLPSYVINGSDTFVCLRMLQVAKKCICIEQPLYFYRIRTNSTSNVNYYKERYLSYDAVFYEGVRLLDVWGKNTLENYYYLCILHLGGMEMNLNLIYNARDILLEERLDFIENLLNIRTYRNYVKMFPEERKKNWENKINEILDKIYNMSEQNRLLFYKYNFSRRFIAKKSISEASSSYNDIILYIATVLGRENAIPYEDDLLNLSIQYATGKDCISFQDACDIISIYMETGDKESQKKEMMKESILAGNYEKLETILDSFSNEMLLDKEVLMARACCSYVQGDIENALLFLAIGNEFYPEDDVIKANLNVYLNKCKA